MYRQYAKEILEASYSDSGHVATLKSHNNTSQRYYARIKNIWNRKEKYVVKMLNFYLFDANCYWIYHKGNIYSINLNDPQIFYIHTVQTLMHKIKYAAIVEKNCAKAAVLLIDNTGCTVSDAYKILKALSLY